MNRNRKLVFSNHVNNVFTTLDFDYDSAKNLMLDLALHRDIYDEDGNKISKQMANEKLREITLAIFELEPGFSDREYHRAMKKHSQEWFEIVEETVDEYIAYGMRENEIFNQLVNVRSRALGQDNLFWVPEKDVILSIAKVGTSHHDYILQRLGKGESYAVPVARYGAAVGMELNRYMAGQEDWDKLIATLAKSFTMKQQVEIYNLAMSAATQLPVTTGFVGTGAFSTSTKAAVDAIIENVSAANDGAEVVAIGTRTALKNFTKLGDVNWIAPSMKESVAHTGLLGDYEGTDLIVVEQRFADSTLTTKLFDDTKILFLAKGVDNKLIDMFTYGETEIDEITEKGEEHGRYDDLGKYEIQMSWGMAVRVKRMFGQWTLTQ